MSRCWLSRWSHSAPSDLEWSRPMISLLDNRAISTSSSKLTWCGIKFSNNRLIKSWVRYSPFLRVGRPARLFASINLCYIEDYTRSQKNVNNYFQYLKSFFLSPKKVTSTWLFPMSRRNHRMHRFALRSVVVRPTLIDSLALDVGVSYESWLVRNHSAAQHK